MAWLPAILMGLLIGVAGAAYAGFVADRAVSWLRISSFEGNSGYFVVFMILLGFVGSVILGIVLCRMTGGAGLAGVLRGTGIALAGVVGSITLLGALAWAQQERPVDLGGVSLDVAIEVRLPPGWDAPAFDGGRAAYVTLYSGHRPHMRSGPLRSQTARQEGDQWIIPATVEILSDQGDRRIGVKIPESTTWFFRTDIPARPTGEDAAFSDWRAPDRSLSDSDRPPPPDGLAIRYRVILRAPLEPPPPPEEWSRTGRQALPAEDAPTEAWLAFTTVATPPATRARALRAVQDRPEFVPLLIARIGDPDPATARDALYLVGEMRPPPSAVGDAVRARIADIIAIAESIDPQAEGSRDDLYDRVHVLASGVLAAAHGLRRAGVEIRPDLAALAAAAGPREKSPRDIADSAERIIAYFDRLDREGRVSD